MAEDAIGVKPTVDADTTTSVSPSEENTTSTAPSEDDGFMQGFIGSLDTPEESTKPETSEPTGTEEPELSKPEQPESPKPEEKTSRADARKQQLNSEIRERIAERNALRDEIAALSRQKYDLASSSDIPTVDSLLEQINPDTGDYYTRAEAENLRLNKRLDAFEKQQEFNAYVERVADARVQLSSEANRVVKDFPIFDPESDEYNAELTAAADELMQNSLIKDEKTGQVIGARVSPYQLYSTIAKAKASGEAGGKTSGRKAALDMMNNADISSSAKAPTSSSKNDEFLAGFMGEQPLLLSCSFAFQLN